MTTEYIRYRSICSITQMEQYIYSILKISVWKMKNLEVIKWRDGNQICQNNKLA